MPPAEASMATKIALARQCTRHSPDSAIAIRSIVPLSPAFANIGLVILL